MDRLHWHKENIMIDWRLESKEAEYWNGKKLFRMSFPEFWEQAYRTKNNFYHYVFDEAKRHVELLGEYAEYLEDERCRKFWQRHCSLCTKEITTDINEKCYCSEDGLDWLCAECYNDFNEQFKWQVTDIKDIPAENFIALELLKSNK